MTTLLILLSIFIACAVLFVRVTGKGRKRMIAQYSGTNPGQQSSYQLYLNWCKRNNLTPVSEERFEGLTDGQGRINIADMIALHPDLSPTGDSSSDEAERRKKDQEFLNSAIIGYMTDSTVKGTLLGGSLFGGMLGSHLSKKKKK